MIMPVLRSIVPDRIKMRLKNCVSMLRVENLLMLGDYRVMRKLIRKIEHWDEERIRKWQTNKLREIVSYAYNHVPGYHMLYRDAGVSPDDIRSIDDACVLPFTTKTLLRENQSEFVSKVVPERSRYHVTTGGSSGDPLGFSREYANDQIENAFIHDLWARHVYPMSFRKKRTVLRGDRVAGIFRYEPNVGLILSSYEINENTINRYVEVIDQYRTPIFHAYPSAAHLMAIVMQKTGLRCNHVYQCIMLGSEPLYEYQKNLIEQVFGAKICHWYGQTERVVLAGDCETSPVLHAYPQYGLTEIIRDDGKWAGVGEIGEIVGTSFWCLATPLIRYRTADYGEYGGAACPTCQRPYPLINRVEGRLQEFVVDKMGNNITLTALFFAHHLRSFAEVNRMQIIQDRAGEITVTYVAEGDLSRESSDEIRETVRFVTKGRMEVNIRRVNGIPLSKIGKMKFLVQNLNLRS